MTTMKTRPVAQQLVPAVGLALAGLVVLLADAVLVGDPLPAAGPRAGGGRWIIGPPATQPDDGSDEPEDDAGDGRFIAQLRKLTGEEINRIRFMELRGMREGTDSTPDPVTVRIGRKVVDEFLTVMDGTPNFTGEEARRAFRRLTPAQKLHVMAAERRTEFADKVQIKTDPQVFKEFRQQVLPVVLQGCATAGCHAPGSGEEVKFRLFNDPKRSPETTYANFLILNDLEVGGRRVLHRADPPESLLLTCMLPPEEVKPALRHPGSKKFRPVFQNRAVRGFRQIEQWIASLKHPAEDYGTRLVDRPAASQPADEEAEDPSREPWPRRP
jgi:hypothetical protein